MKIKTDYLKKLSAWLLPYTCILCRNPSDTLQDLCLPCKNELPYLLFACPHCAKPSAQNTPCLSCSNAPYDRTHALFLYEVPATTLIMNLKFGHALMNARILGELFLEKIQSDWYRDKPLPEAIIPMPMHPKRLQERGYNQAIEIARPIAKTLHLPLELTACQRLKHTAAQATLQAEQRGQNIKNAFGIIKKLSYRHVAVIDDVITTGQTMTEFCRILKQAGVQTIDAWCCARPVF